jgi:hypothetical protein
MLRSNLIKRSLTGGVVIASLGLPAAAQAVVMASDPGGTVSSPPAQVAGAPSAQPTGGQSEFQWGDAGVGAAGTVVLLGAGVAAAGVARRRRTHRAIVG